MKLKAKGAFKILNPQTDDFMFGSIAANRGGGDGAGEEGTSCTPSLDFKNFDHKLQK
jgi:hypothetical protein